MMPIETPIRRKPLIFVINRLSRLVGNIVKIISYPFHAVFPKLRFTIPEQRAACLRSGTSKIRRTIWQTNYTNRVSLPMYCNYLFNRLMSLDCEYRYVSTEAREQMLREYADETAFAAYSRLTDGAAQADFWRMFVLHRFGGIYIDIDAQLCCPTAWSVGADDSEIVIQRKDEYSNYFLAAAASNPLLADTLAIIQDNIENSRTEGGVFHMTGPTTLMQAMQNRPVHIRNARYTCLQGTFSNEYFQYIDKKRGKWIHAKPEDLLK